VLCGLICPARAIWASCVAVGFARRTKQAEFIPLLWPHSGRSNGLPFKSALFYCTERFRAICLQCVQIHHLANCDQIALAEPGKEETPFGARSPDHFFLHLEANAWQFSLWLCLSAAKSNFLTQQLPIEFFARLKVTQSRAVR
jgi:hypothetical protein